MATPRAPFFTSTTRSDSPTVMVVGKSGMGKSTLCNYLLYGSPRPDAGFQTEPGQEPVTEYCESKWVSSTQPPRTMQPTRSGGPLTVIDTPGIPDPKARTLEFYNDIVMSARNSGGLNALIIAVHYGVDRQQLQDDFETYRILLKQFARLPCLKILLGRVRIQPGLTEAQHHAEMAPVEEWLNTIGTAGGMEGAKKVIISDNDSQAAQFFELRQAVCQAPKVPIQDFIFRTYPELIESVARLIDGQTRDDALRENIPRLQEEKAELDRINEKLLKKSWKAKKVGSFLSALILGGGLLVDMCTGLAFIGVVTAGSASVAGATKSAASGAALSINMTIETNKLRQAEIDEEVATIASELENGLDSAALQRDSGTLRELEQVASAGTITYSSRLKAAQDHG